ncbi:MAG: cytochrome ubiquinol oxidase subunit I [Acidobacteriia bacterium]|nr:cytochrome ubiquinol oxidase subunit I [Methyloceanibacter sp.]MBX5471749.1 cytochrome ubiquinol oxidase subunit I [Acetobacteraceae bacterium]MCL6491977.1 cytochrome ubiquinol oxidase subunit I [Terriglobia bacterium]
MDLLTLSRLQFALTALYHFLFVPLTLGLSVLLAVMESIYVTTGKTIWRDITKFWGTLFGINFAMGVATGITMEFQFGTNWAYYSHYVGDIFGAPLAIEGLMAFFLESTFVGLFFFGWQRLSRVQHLAVTVLMALGTQLSALWILIANAWMQYPVGARFDLATMRMEVADFWAVIFNPVAQAKFVHTVSAGYVVGSMFVLSISAYYLLHAKYRALAIRSMTVAASFGLASALSVVVLGDESGYMAGQNQKMKVAAIEADWETEKPPASFTLIGIPDLAKRRTDYAVRIPYVLGMIATRSLNEEVAGIINLVDDAKRQIASGMLAYGAMQTLRAHPDDAQARATFEEHVRDLGYALLLKRYRPDVDHATPQEIEAAAWDTVPPVLPLFFTFRLMVALGFYFIALFAVMFWQASKRQLEKHRWLLRVCLWSLPLPWLAAELGWYVAETGRQPWTIDGVLPTFLSVSSVSATNVVLSLLGFVILYSALAIVDVYLMVRVIREGPAFTTEPPVSLRPAPLPAE